MFFHDFPGIFQDFPGLFPPFPMANSPGRHRRGGGVGLEPSTRTHLQARGAQDQQAPRRAPLAQSRVDGVAMDMWKKSGWFGIRYSIFRQKYQAGWWFQDVLSGWWLTFFFPQRLGIMIPTDELIFFRGVETTNQTCSIYFMAKLEKLSFFLVNMGINQLFRLGHFSIAMWKLPEGNHSEVENEYRVYIYIYTRYAR